MIREYRAMNMILYRTPKQYEDANITVIQGQIRKITTTSNNYVHYYTAMHATRYDNDNNRGSVSEIRKRGEEGPIGCL